MVGLELVLDERAAEGKAALADGAVEGQRGGGAATAVKLDLFRVLKDAPQSQRYSCGITCKRTR